MSPALTGSERHCPACGSDWRGASIPMDIRQYYGTATHWHRLIGIEVPGLYDGVHHWRCPDCAKEFPRVGISEPNRAPHKYNIIFPCNELASLGMEAIEHTYEHEIHFDPDNHLISLDDINLAVEDLHSMGIYDFEITVNPIEDHHHLPSSQHE